MLSHHNQLPQKKSIAKAVREIADNLKNETNIQVKATSKILSNAAKIAVNQDQLIDEIVDVVIEDLDTVQQTKESRLYIIGLLKKKYGTFHNAKSHLGVKARSWSALINKLNNQSIIENRNNNETKLSLNERLSSIETEIENINYRVDQLFVLLKQISQYQDFDNHRT